MTTPAFPLGGSPGGKTSPGTTTAWGYGVSYVDKSGTVLERFIMDALTEAHARNMAASKPEKNVRVDGSGPAAGQRVTVEYGPVFGHEVTRSAWEPK